MKRCSTCGMLYSDMVTECPTCKIPLGGNPQSSPVVNPSHVTSPVQTQPPVQNQPPVVDKGGFLWYIPGLLMPIAGLIVGFCVKKKKPNSASAAFKGAGIGFVANIILSNIAKFL